MANAAERHAVTAIGRCVTLRGEGKTDAAARAEVADIAPALDISKLSEDGLKALALMNADTDESRRYFCKAAARR
jgi:hypothetical protein